MRQVLIIALGAALLVGCGGSKAATPTPTSLPAPTKEAQPAFTQAEIVSLASQQVSALPAIQNTTRPAGANYVRCTSAQFHSANRMWVVSCDYLVNKTDTTPVQTSTYTVNDADGKLVK